MDNSQAPQPAPQSTNQGANPWKTQDNTEQREQPWKNLIDQIVDDAQKNPLDKDFFPCQDGFEAHTLAA